RVLVTVNAPDVVQPPAGQVRQRHPNGVERWASRRSVVGLAGLRPAPRAESRPRAQHTRRRISPREVVRETLRVNAAAVIFAHNHPSGNPEPSQADELITSRLKNALALIDVRTLDHIIVGGDRTTSFAERGLL